MGDRVDLDHSSLCWHLFEYVTAAKRSKGQSIETFKRHMIDERNRIIKDGDGDFLKQT